MRLIFCINLRHAALTFSLAVVVMGFSVPRRHMLSASSAWIRPRPPTPMRRARPRGITPSTTQTAMASRISLPLSAPAAAGRATRRDSTTATFTTTSHAGRPPACWSGRTISLAPDVMPRTTAADDANHYLERAGMYMKPGYLLPVFDLEDGNTEHSPASADRLGHGLHQHDFQRQGHLPDRLHQQLVQQRRGRRRAGVVQFRQHAQAQTRRTYQWVARPSGNLQTGEPAAATNYPNPYGVWDPNFITRTNSRDPAINPWAFWQNGDTARRTGSSSTSTPPTATSSSSKTFSSRRCGPTPAAATGDHRQLEQRQPTLQRHHPRPGQRRACRTIRASTGSSCKIAAAAPSRSPAAPTRSASSTRSSRSTSPAGRSSVGYVPGSGGKWDLPSEFNAAVTLSSGASYSAHTTQVDGGGGQFNINGGTVTFTEIQLASHASNSGKIVMGGDATFAQTGGDGNVRHPLHRLARAGGQRHASPPATARSPSTTARPASTSMCAPRITGAGRLVKSGAGTMQLSNANTYSGGTTITQRRPPDRRG